MEMEGDEDQTAKKEAEGNVVINQQQKGEGREAGQEQERARNKTDHEPDPC